MKQEGIESDKLNLSSEENSIKSSPMKASQIVQEVKEELRNKTEEEQDSNIITSTSKGTSDNLSKHLAGIAFSRLHSFDSSSKNSG